MEGDFLSFYEKVLADNSLINEKTIGTNSILHRFLLSKDANSHFEKIKYLVENRADLNLMNDDQETPLLFAAKNNHVDLPIFSYLIENKADPNNTENPVLNCLVGSEEHLEKEKIKYLLQNGVDINLRDYDNKNSFEIYCYNEDTDLEIFKLFLDNKASLNINNEEEDDEEEYNDSPFQIILINPKLSLEVLNFFLENKADLNLGKEENTPLSILCSNQSMTKEMLFKMIEKSDKTIDLYYPLLTLCSNPAISVEMLEYFLKADSSLEIQIPFLEVCKNTSLTPQILRFFIENKADISFLNHKQESPLHYLCKNSNLSNELLSFFDKEIPKNVKNFDYFTPFLIYSKNNHPKLDVFKHLIEKKADIESTDNANNSYLHFVCAMNPNVEILQFLLEKNDRFINVRSKHGSTPLNIICKNKNVTLDIIKLMIEHKGDVFIEKGENSRENSLHLLIFNQNFPYHASLFEIFDLTKKYYGTTLLHSLFIKHKVAPSLVQYIIDKKVDINMKDINGNNFLNDYFSSLQNVDASIVQLLLENKSDINLKNNFMRTVVDCYINHSFLDKNIFSLFFEHKLDPNTKIEDSTLLNLICKDRNVSKEIIQFFVSNNADINFSNSDGSVLHNIVKNSDLNSEYISWLIENKSDLNIINQNKSTPLHVLSHYYFKLETLKLFLDNGADVNLVNSSGLTPYDVFENYNTLKNEKDLLDKRCVFLSHLNSVRFHIINRTPNLVNPLFNDLLLRGSIWKPERHHYYSPFFRSKIFNFLLCLKSFLSTKFPRPLLHLIISFSSSIKIIYPQTKRKDAKKKGSTNKRLKN